MDIKDINFDSILVTTTKNEVILPKDVDLLQEMLKEIYTEFKLAETPSQKIKLMKIILNILDLKWKYLGLERKTTTIDKSKLVEALKKAGINIPD